MLAHFLHPIAAGGIGLSNRVVSIRVLFCVIVERLGQLGSPEADSAAEETRARIDE